MFLVDCQTDQNFSHFLWHLNHKSFIEELLLTNDQSCDTWPLLDFVPLVILVAICFEVFQASNAMKWRSNFAFFQNYKSHFLQQFNKYFRVRQGKIHFQYHIVGPERKYWKWISIHFLPPINHIWPPGANISCSPKNDIFHQMSNKQSWRPIFQLWDVKICEPILNCEKAILSWQRDNFQRWKGHFMLVSDYQNQRHLQKGK